MAPGIVGLSHRAAAARALNLGGFQASGKGVDAFGRRLDRSTNRLIGWFFTTMFVVTIAFAVIVGVHYLLGWW